DRFIAEKRSAIMAAVRSRDTGLEMAVRRALHAAGLRYRLHVKDLPGTPDIVLVRQRLAVFVHGCFWHGHTCTRGKLPSTNFAFWQEKSCRNRKRDSSVRRKLKKLGWTSVVIWQCRINKDTPGLIESAKRRRYIQIDVAMYSNALSIKADKAKTPLFS